jgi:hypothetical protein
MIIVERLIQNVERLMINVESFILYSKSFDIQKNYDSTFIIHLST